MENVTPRAESTNMSASIDADSDAQGVRLERFRLLAALREENAALDDNIRADVERLRELRLGLVRARLAVELDASLRRVSTVAENTAVTAQKP